MPQESVIYMRPLANPYLSRVGLAFWIMAVLASLSLRCSAPRPMAEPPVRAPARSTPGAGCTADAMLALVHPLRDAADAQGSSPANFSARIAELIGSIRSCATSGSIEEGVRRTLFLEAHEAFAQWYDANPSIASALLVASRMYGVEQDPSGGMERLSDYFLYVSDELGRMPGTADTRLPTFRHRDAMMSVDALLGRIAFLASRPMTTDGAPSIDEAELAQRFAELQGAWRVEALSWADLTVDGSSSEPTRPHPTTAALSTTLSFRLSSVSTSVRVVAERWHEGRNGDQFREGIGGPFAGYLGTVASRGRQSGRSFTWPVVVPTFEHPPSIAAFQGAREVTLARAIHEASFDRFNVRAAFAWNEALMKAHGVLLRAMSDAVTAAESERDFHELEALLSRASSQTLDAHARASGIARVVRTVGLLDRTAEGRNNAGESFPMQRAGLVSLRLAEVSLCHLNRAWLAGSADVCSTGPGNVTASTCATLTPLPEFAAPHAVLPMELRDAYSIVLATIASQRNTPSAPSSDDRPAAPVEDSLRVHGSTWCDLARIASPTLLVQRLHLDSQALGRLFILAKAVAPPLAPHLFAPIVLPALRVTAAERLATCAQARMIDCGLTSIEQLQVEASSQITLNLLRRDYCRSTLRGAQLCSDVRPPNRPPQGTVLDAEADRNLTVADAQEIISHCDGFAREYSQCQLALSAPEPPDGGAPDPSVVAADSAEVQDRIPSRSVERWPSAHSNGRRHRPQTPASGRPIGHARASVARPVPPAGVEAAPRRPIGHPRTAQSANRRYRH